MQVWALVNNARGGDAAVAVFANRELAREVARGTIRTWQFDKNDGVPAEDVVQALRDFDAEAAAGGNAGGGDPNCVFYVEILQLPVLGA